MLPPTLPTSAAETLSHLACSRHDRITSSAYPKVPQVHVTHRLSLSKTLVTLLGKPLPQRALHVLLALKLWASGMEDPKVLKAHRFPAPGPPAAAQTCPVSGRRPPHASSPRWSGSAWRRLCCMRQEAVQLSPQVRPNHATAIMRIAEAWMRRTRTRHKRWPNGSQRAGCYTTWQCFAVSPLRLATRMRALEASGSCTHLALRRRRSRSTQPGCADAERCRCC